MKLEADDDGCGATGAIQNALFLPFAHTRSHSDTILSLSFKLKKY